MPTVRDTPDAVLAAFAAKGMFPTGLIDPPTIVGQPTKSTKATVLEPEKWSITLPLPPTTNNLFLTAGRKRVKTPQYRDWQARVATILRKTDKWTGGYPIAVTIAILGGSDWRMNSDIANREKATVDALVSARIIHSDSCKHISRLQIRFEPGPKGLPSVVRVEISADLN